MAKTEEIAAGAADWTERTLSTGWKLCVEGEGTLRVSDGEGWMFMVPLRNDVSRKGMPQPYATYFPDEYKSWDGSLVHMSLSKESPDAAQ